MELFCLRNARDNIENAKNIRNAPRKSFLCFELVKLLRGNKSFVCVREFGLCPVQAHEDGTQVFHPHSRQGLTILTLEYNYYKCGTLIKMKVWHVIIRRASIVAASAGWSTLFVNHL